MKVRHAAALLMVLAALPPSAARASEAGSPNGWRLSQWNAVGRIDWQLMRMRETGMEPMSATRGMLMAAEVETTATLNTGTRDVIDLALQWPYATDMGGIDDRGKQMHFGNAYAVVKLGLGKPNVRLGQFVVPFGNLATYETHTRPLQTLYAQSLGIRIDRGIGLDGMAGAYDYWIAAIGGNGPRADLDKRPAYVARVARRYEGSSGGRLTAGLSGLYGRAMPRFSPGVDPLTDDVMAAMPMHHFMTFVDKTRICLDLEYELGQDTWRAEIVGGRDSDGAVDGQFLQWSRALDGTTEVGAQAARWAQPIGTRTTVGAWVGRTVGPGGAVRLAFSHGSGRLHGDTRRSTMLTLQVSQEFGLKPR